MQLSTKEATELLPKVIEAVQEAGELLRAQFHALGGPQGRSGKADVDTTIERMLVARLRQELPCACVAEETLPGVPRSGEVWVIDPHDGTSDFLAGRRGSAISVALLRDFRPVLGVVYAPLAPDDHGDLFAWAEGSELTRNGEIVVEPHGSSRFTIALNADAGSYALHNHVALRGMRVRALPSPAYRLALAAVGEVDVGASLVAGLAPWDVAGGHALLAGAGKKLADRHGKPVDYAMPWIDGCLGGTAEAIQRVLEAKLGPGKAAARPIVLPIKKVRDPLLLRRAQGCLLGQLAGDALGSAVEFEAAAEIRKKFPEGVLNLEDGGTWNLLAGQPTDDSEMALALARALVSGGGYSADQVARAYIAWLDSEPFDCGNTTAAGIRALRGIGSPALSSQSNGALMRVAPIGIFAASDPARAACLARQDAALTHPHPVCQAANASYAAAISVAVAGGDEADMFKAALEHAGRDDGAATVRSCLEAAQVGAPQDFQRNMGWVLTALQNSFFWLLRKAPFQDAVVATVGSGGDTDTNGAIAGALLGARLGRDAIPLQWRNAVLTCRPVAAPGVHHPRPVTYWPDDALELAESLLAAGETAR
jgi:ADP-ribosyl-[dinitrogen reductase] hydrolase